MEPEIETYSFPAALELLKLGRRISRKGWNGQSQYCELATNISYKNAKGEIVNAEHLDSGSAAIAFVGTRGVQVGWVASQSDMLSEDWIVLPEESEQCELNL
jgi:hypothetical protein